MKLGNIKNKNFFSILFFFCSFLVSYFILTTHYDVSDGLDWDKYSNYLRMYLINEIEIEVGQGSIYFYFISFCINLLGKFVGPYNLTEVVNQGVQFGNSLIYLTGCLGLFKLLTQVGINSRLVINCLTILNFFPPSLYLRLTLKPEIFAFCLLPWIIYEINKLTFKTNRVNSLNSAILLATIFTTKGSIIGMTILAIAIIFYKEFLNIFKNYFFLSALIFLTILFNYENFIITGKHIFQNQVIDSFLYTPNFSFFYNVDILKLITDPYKNIHASSLISITLLDTFNDYFDFFWNNDESFFVQNVIKFSSNYFIQNYIRQYLGIILSFFLYLYLIIEILRKNQFRNYYYLPFIGITILTINSLGFPSKNFDPLTADTFKVHYYAFLLSVTFVIVLIDLYSKFNKFVFLLIPLFIFFIGFPKNYDSLLKEQILTRFNLSEICITEGSSSGCRNILNITCLSDPIVFNIDFEDNIRFRESKLNYYLPIKLIKEENIVFSRTRGECISYFKNGYRFENQFTFFQNYEKVPWLNLFFLIAMPLYKIYEYFKKITQHLDEFLH